MRTSVWVALGVGAVATVALVLAILVWPDGLESVSTEKHKTAEQGAASTALPTSDATSQADNSAAGSPPRNAPTVMPAANSLDKWMFIALVTMAIAMLISSAISFYLYRWRKILLSNPHMVVPEQLGEWTGSLTKHVHRFTEAVSTNLNESARLGQQTKQGISDLSETFMTMQQALDEREREIQRLKRGYDSEIFRKFVARFIRVDQAVEDFQRSGSADEAGLDQIRRLLEDAFSECNVECFQPELGSDYREAVGVADQPKTAKAESPEDDFKIAEILESGYLIRSAENSEVIKPSKVRIYTFSEGDGQKGQVEQEGGKT